MILVGVSADQNLAEVIAQMPAAIRAALVPRVTALALILQAHIQKNKLSGQVLNVVSGALRRSIHSTGAIETDTGVYGEVRSSGDVKYARIHELGGRTKAHVIEPVKAKALAFMFNGKMSFFARVNHPGSVIPERSYMRTGLADKAAEIQTSLKMGVIEGMIAAGGRVSA